MEQSACVAQSLTITESVRARIQGERDRDKIDEMNIAAASQ